VIILTEKIVFLVIMIKRLLEHDIQDRLFQGKALVVIGPRQVGKTTLIRQLLADRPHLFLNGDDPDVRQRLDGISTSGLKSIIGSNRLVFFDEAQRIPGIGQTLKLITDQLKGVQVLVTGSSALELGDQTRESLTGRKVEYKLFPVSWEEFESGTGYLEAEQQLEERLIFGMYPEIISRRADSIMLLKEITGGYLYKDILSLAGIRKPETLDKLLKALALKVGNEVSYNELSQILEVDKITVMKYIDLLEKTMVVFRLTSFSRNIRNEIRNNRKIYFHDNGIRNAIINNLNPLDLRTDKGALWENFLVSERIKYQAYHQVLASNYFWRNKQKQEIDFVEESGGFITAWEFKWSSAKAKKIPSAFREQYNAEGKIIHRGNFREFIMPAAL